MNPRIVKGRRGTDVAFAARGRANGEAFQIGVRADALSRYDRLRLEDRLLQEATSLISLSDFDWTAYRFARNEEFEVWEKTLSVRELAILMDR